MGVISILTNKNNKISNEKYKTNKAWSDLIADASHIPLSSAVIENMINSVTVDWK